MQTTSFLGEPVGERAQLEPKPSFKPSQVDLNFTLPNPFVGLFEHIEAELAAAVIVRACQVLGDIWQSVELKALGEIILRDNDARVEPIYSIFRNPFCHPSPHDLVKRGYATWVDSADGHGNALAFTSKGMERLSKRVRQPSLGG
jgi:hypothetical protein